MPWVCPDQVSYGEVISKINRSHGDTTVIRDRVNRIKAFVPFGEELFKAWVEARYQVRTTHKGDGRSLLRATLAMAQIEGALAFLVATSDLNPPDLSEDHTPIARVEPYTPGDDE